MIGSANMMPQASIIIPTYNSGPLVVEVVISMLAKTGEPITVIFVDDESMDETRLGSNPRQNLRVYGESLVFGNADPSETAGYYISSKAEIKTKSKLSLDD